MLGGTREEIFNALSHAWIDNSSLRTYRHAPNTAHVNHGLQVTQRAAVFILQ